jgi:hypothetical protein
VSHRPRCIGCEQTARDKTKAGNRFRVKARNAIRTCDIRLSNDGFFNLTDMAVAAGKGRNFAREWLESVQGKEYLKLAQEKSKHEISCLLRIARGGPYEDRGTWAHYKIARRFAQALLIGASCDNHHKEVYGNSHRPTCLECHYWPQRTTRHLGPSVSVNYGRAVQRRFVAS